MLKRMDMIEMINLEQLNNLNCKTYNWLPIVHKR